MHIKKIALLFILLFSNYNISFSEDTGKTILGTDKLKEMREKHAAVMKKIEELRQQRTDIKERTVESGQSHVAEMQKAYKEAKPFDSSVLSPNPADITKAGGTPFTGKFACDKNAGGTFSGSGQDRPKNQGGKIEDELFYAVANAAKASGAKVTLVSGFRAGATVAGTGKTSQHASGKALDIKIEGDENKKANFITFFIANTDKYNSLGSYAGKLSHTHVGGDCGGRWCHFKGKEGGTPGQAETWKKKGLLQAELHEDDKSTTKPVANEKAKRGAAGLCGKNTPTS